MTSKPEFHTLTLPNGIRCIHKQVKSPVAYCALTVNTGSRDELPSEHGIAHMTEHTIFKGTRKRRAYHINCRLENLGGELNAFTTKEETVIHTTTLKGDFSKAVELLSDLAFNSVFPQKEVEKEREVIIDEINSYKDSPAEMIFDEFEDLLFEGSPLGHNILGSKASVSKIGSDELRAFVSRTYNTDQMVISSIGNISPGAFDAAMQRHFGVAQVSHRSFGRVAPAENRSFTVAKNRSTHQAHCIVGCRAPGVDDERRLPLALLVNMLGGPSANSMLNLLVREKNALSYNVEANYTPFTDTGIATIYFGTDKYNVDRCLELIFGQIESLKRDAVSPRRLSMAKKQFLGQLTVSMDNNENYMLGAAKSFLLYGEVDGLDTIYRKVVDISAGDIVETARSLFTDMSILHYK